jgi:hypothetical protein
MALLIECKLEHGWSKLCIYALWFVGHNDFDHNHFEGEIPSYKNAWATFAKMHVCEGGIFLHWIKV